jgi:TolB-like protein/Flp pilus assembly protein TadD
VEFDHNLNNAISRLREALGDSAESPRFIETVPRRGYRFLAPVETVPAPAREAPARAPADPPESVSASSAHLRLIVLGLVAVVLVGALFYRVMNPQSRRIDSVAVLPFVTADSTERSPDEYVAFGMTEALIAELSRVGALKVISQTSVLQYKDKRKPLPEIARELGVGAIVEGSVVNEGGQVRITVQLIDARSDTHLWAQTYRRETGSILALQGDLAQSIAGEIQVRLAGKAASPLPASRPVEAPAREAYLKGSYFLQRRGEESMGRAREYFEQAIAADPHYARAHAGLADYYTLTDSMPPSVAFPKAKAYARKALELDGNLADAHVSLAYVSYYGDWNWIEAEREFRRAIELDPNHAQARYWFGRFLGTMGRKEEATEQMQRALSLDPLSITAHDSAAMLWFNTRQFERMLEQGNRIHELEPRDYRTYEHLTVAYLHTARYEQAFSAAQQGLALLPQEPLFVLFLAIVESRRGRAREATKTFRLLESMDREGHVPDVFLAIGAAQLGRKDQAMEHLQIAHRNRDPYMVLLKTIPWFDPIRDDPRYQGLLRRLNFPK